MAEPRLSAGRFSATPSAPMAVTTALRGATCCALVERYITFRRKSYQESGAQANEVARLEVSEFIRRFLVHVLPNGFQRIRYYGFLSNGHRAEKLALCRRLLDVQARATDPNRRGDKESSPLKGTPPPCPCCGGRMKIIETFDGSRVRPHHVRSLDGL
jgi:Putative transposase